MTDSTHRERRQVMRPCQPELTLAPHGGEGPDPRLIEVVRLLARRAARKAYELETKDRTTPRS